MIACGDDDPANQGEPVVKHLYFSQDNNGNGLFELDMATGAATLVGTGETATTSVTIGLTETANPATLLGSTYADIANIAADGSGATVLANSQEAEALAMNITTGILYGCINASCFTIDPVTGMSTGAIAGPGVDLEGLAADPDNNVIYGIGNTNNLYVYRVADDMWNLIGDTGRNWNQGGLAYDDVACALRRRWAR
jgi:hypothetical protein